MPQSWQFGASHLGLYEGPRPNLHCFAPIHISAETNKTLNQYYIALVESGHAYIFLKTWFYIFAPFHISAETNKAMNQYYIPLVESGHAYYYYFSKT